ncbi:hypothetical protein NK553_14680 [Pseudomonas sp. ZM23]|uniref:Uncharacterized protein n=1 Tax=Pseudomonas triclosanedens TaxID=2961893 RepID=A0ABY6ZW81_9PSED|nr:hypothetical protein [Pseudomonas triclosanedens]MCP8465195.1 hypothetical protein [Pseudomonas triclosanedens]MCP8470865.1 hypothetical protein [Pseudomonas triclosanedens]MCP8476566.1 hypothetical protein [Pseudomonas triclosanedens]WAI49049.1 hypothetical protein OU419_25420 [Pseudomonas triclosanedens]
MRDHELAISQLAIAAQIAEHNAPINVSEGDLVQAGLEYQVAADCRAAIEVLEHQEPQQ